MLTITNAPATHTCDAECYGNIVIYGVEVTGCNLDAARAALPKATA